MNRSNRSGVEWPGQALFSHKLCGVLVAAALFGILWSVGTSTHGAQPKARPATRLLATPVRIDELIRLLDDPRPEIRLEAINCIATLNLPAKDTVPALRGRFDDPVPLVRVQAVRVAIRAGMPAQKGVPVAARLLLPDQPEVCCAAAQILGDAGSAARDVLPQLHACLAAPSNRVRTHAAQAVLKIDASDAVALNYLRSAKETERGDANDFAATAVDNVVHDLILQLRHVDPAVRLAAAIRLEQLGTAAARAKRALVGRLSDPDLLVRAHVARAALRTGAPVEPIVEVAAELLVCGQVEVLRVAASILVEIGPDAAAALPRLHDCLEASSLAVRLYAAEATLRIDPTDQLAVETLHAALDSQENEVRFFSVNALGAAVRVNDGAVFAVLCALSDPDPKVATAAAVHLSRTQNEDWQTLPGGQEIDSDDPESMPAEVAEWISDLSDAAAELRQAAAIRLAIAGPAACHAVEALTTALGDPDPIVRLHVALAIWEIGRNGYPIYPVLVDLLLTNETDTRIGAAYALGRMGPAARDTLPWLTKLLNETETIDRLPLAASIVQIDPARPGILDILAGDLRVADADVRYLSAVALGAVPLSRQAAVEQMVLLAASDRNFHVRCAACESLNQLQERRAAVYGAQPATQRTVEPAAATGTSSR